MNFDSKKVFLAIGLIFLASVSRLFPILPNFQPLMAIAIFGGAVFSSNRTLSFSITFGALILSDILLHFFSESLLGYYAGFHESMLAVYLSFGLIVLLSSKLNSNLKPLNIFGSSLLSAIIFFIITNLSSWLFSLDINNMPYSKDFSGLVRCYYEAIPFFRYSVASVLLYSGILFGIYFTAEKFVVAPASNS